MPIRAFARFLSHWRTSTALDREVIDAVVAPEHRGPSEELRDALDGWPGIHYWSHRERPNRLVLIRALGPPPRERWGLHILLFVITFLTVWAAGGYLITPGIRWVLPNTIEWVRLVEVFRDWFPIEGLGFAAALMGILLAHEMGHYVVAKRYQINASPPYFLPAPPPINFIGTFGAFIRLRSPIMDRRQLLDVGAAGPWAGFVIAAAVLAYGLVNSQVYVDVAGETAQFIYINGRPFFLGDSLLMTWARSWLVGEGTVLLHPLALAGWFGILVTMLNLLPLGQLDGGHILYSLIGKHQATVGRLMFYVLLILGRWFWGWWLWALLILILGRGRIAHPSVLDPHRPIPGSRWPAGLATAALFAVTFSADPLPSIL